MADLICLMSGEIFVGLDAFSGTCLVQFGRFNPRKIEDENAVIYNMGGGGASPLLSSIGIAWRKR